MHGSLPDLICWYLVFLFSVVAHEAGHAMAAWKLGDPTAYTGGQVTLNPIPHIKREPIGTVVLPLLSFASQGWMIGWASTPINRLWAQANPRRSALVAAAGPAVNLLIVACALLVIKATLGTGWLMHPAGSFVSMDGIVAGGTSGISLIVAKILSITYCLNVILLLFNLMPVPPLDGGSMLKLILPGSLQQPYARFLATPAIPLMGLLAAWFLFPRICGPLLRYAIGLAGQ